MRVGVGAVVLACLSVAWAVVVRAAALPSLHVEPLRPLAPGEHATLQLALDLGPHGARPLLLTAVGEGEAVEVVRGRLLRSDARDPEATVLRFDLPLRGRSAGRSVVHLRVDGYLCPERCEPVRLDASAVVQVRP